jgi:hypothetical protein
MSYNIYFYCFSGRIGADEALDRLVASFDSHGSSILAAAKELGSEWASILLGSNASALAAGNSRIEFHVGHSLVRDSVSQVAAEDNSGRISQADSLLILTFSGDGIDLPVARAVWEFAASKWNAIPYDDSSGFMVERSDLEE